MVWKSEAGRVGKANFERPDEIDSRLSDKSSEISEPSGSLRTTSNSVWAGAVTEPAFLIEASAASVASMSRSVAVRRRRSPSATIRMLDRIGMVFRRSTTA
jgi:hypothetical protein